MRRLNILIWHIHGSYLNTLARIEHNWYLPIKPDRPEGYGGRGPTFDLPDCVYEVPAEQVRDLKDELWPFMSAFSDSLLRFMERDEAHYDLIHGNFWMSGWVATEMRCRLDIPVVQIFHALGKTKRRHQKKVDTSSGDRIKIELDVIRQTDRIIAQCPSERSELVNDYSADPRKIAIIPSAVNTRIFKPVDRDEARRRIGLHTEIDVLIPTYRRKTGLAVVLTSLLGQTFTDFDVIVSDQTEDDDTYLESVEIQTLVRALRWHVPSEARFTSGHRVTLHRHLPRRGLAEQRNFLLEQSRAPYVHYLDDDVLLDPPVMERMLSVLQAEECGFVGCAATGLGYLGDFRPHQQHIERWMGPVRPEPFEPNSIPWDRHMVNNAANPLHLEQRLVEGNGIVRYKVAWVGGANILYDRAKLLDVGGFSWWHRLPPEHAGEEVVVQFLLIRKYGGCGILPSGTYHLGLPTNVEDRRRNATELFGELMLEYDVHPVRPVEPLRDRGRLSAHS